jgi:CMP-N,N'-diacetyllegionaminic acid synthase
MSFIPKHPDNINDTIYVDIDNTITITDGLEYESAMPIAERINIINEMFDNGYKIIYWTARGSVSKIDYHKLTENQLKSWGCKYTELLMNKPNFCCFIDDKAINSEIFFSSIK